MSEKSNIKKLIESLFQNMAYDVVKKILLIVFASGCSAPCTYALLNTSKLPKWIIICVCVAVAAFVAFVALLIFQAISNRYTRTEKVETKYVILEKIVKFKYDGTKCYYTSEMKLQFNEKAREYYGKFYWSGSGTGRIKPVNKNYRLNELKRRTRYIEYVVVFDRVYKKGQKLTLKLEGVMEDPQKQFSPYFATTVHTPTRKLKIMLEIDPQKYPIDDLEKDIVPPTRCDHEHCTQVQLEYDGTYTWEIVNPTLAYQYSLNWSFRP